MENVRQPKTLRWGTLRFRRVLEYRQVSPGISEGPFYVRVGDPDKTLYLPDAGYLLGHTRTPGMMHRISA
jgi:hypothetical protein